MMNAISEKKDYILEHGTEELTSGSTALIVIDSKKSKFTFAKELIRKLKELFKSEVSKDYINE